MSGSRLCVVFVASFLLTGAATAQTATQPQDGAATTSAHKPGVPPAAPPEIEGAIALLADCVRVQSQAAVDAGSKFSRDTGGEGPVPAQLTLVLTLDGKPTEAWHIKCGLSAEEKAKAKEAKTYFDFGESAGTQVRVWTADDSKRQFEFLRAEVKSTIETAVTEKLVQSELVQRAVSRAVEDQTLVQNAIKQALSNAIDDAIQSKLPQIEDAVKKQLEGTDKDKPKTAASANKP